MEWFKDKILAPLSVAILLAILTALVKIYIAISVLPDKFEIIDQQREQIISLMQNEIDKRIEMDKRIVALETKLEK